MNIWGIIERSLLYFFTFLFIILFVGKPQLTATSAMGYYFICVGVMVLVYSVISIILLTYTLHKPRDKKLEEELKKKYQFKGVNFIVLKDSSFNIMTIHTILSSYIVVSKSLLETMRKEVKDVLIYHEYGHIFYRHYERRMLMDALLMLVILYSYVIGGRALALGAIWAFAFMMEEYSKQFEIEADTFAIIKTKSPESLKLLLILSEDDDELIKARIDNVNKYLEDGVLEISNDN